MYQLLCANYLEKTSNIDYQKKKSNDISVFGILIKSFFLLNFYSYEYEKAICIMPKNYKWFW